MYYNEHLSLSIHMQDLRPIFTPTPTETLASTSIPTPTPTPGCYCRDNVNDLRGGHCLQIKNCPGFGTLGYFTVPKKGGQLGILSNYHVTEGPPNLITSQPDPPVPPNVPSYDATVNTVSFNKFVDASHSEICGIILPALPALKDGTVVPGVQNAQCWDSVRFCGCKSNCTQPGKVHSINWCGKIEFTLKNGLPMEQKFCDQILFTPPPMPGDSGSLLINADTYKATGLVFAGTGIYGLANPIQTVLTMLGVKLDIV